MEDKRDINLLAEYRKLKHKRYKTIKEVETEIDIENRFPKGFCWFCGRIKDEVDANNEDIDMEEEEENIGSQVDRHGVQSLTEKEQVLYESDICAKCYIALY